MKIKFTAAIIFVFVSSLFEIKAQNLFNDNFDSYNCPSGCCPSATGWTCFTIPGFLVYPTHGAGGSPGMTKQMTTLGIVSDSVASPLIGPFNPNSELTFDYRVMEINSYPNFAYGLKTGDKIEVFALYGPTSPYDQFSTLLFTINKANHTTINTFKNRNIPLGTLAGNSGRFIIYVTRTTADFFADFDNFSVDDATGIVETGKTNERALVYPNPSPNGTVLQLKGVEPGTYKGKLVSSSGVVTLEQNLIINSKENSLINTSILNRGMYYLELTGIRNNYKIKFVVKD